MKSWILHIGIFLAVAAVGGALVMGTGVVPIKASSGHWPVTKWLLSFSMSRSVSTHSAGIEPPPGLDDPALVMKGGGHFETGCAPCHGSPVGRPPRIPQHLTPTPPSLAAQVPQWDAEELFYITKHGVKFTGMPAFPTQQRDDEVWAVVAFLQTLPELDAAAYRELVFVDEAEVPEGVPQVAVEACVRCHGAAGVGRGNEAFPKLAGLHRDYFVATMKAYLDGTRHSGIMEPIATRLEEGAIENLADYYAGLAEPVDAEQPNDQSTDTAAIERGEAIAHQGLPQQDVGVCVACHAIKRAEQNPRYPFLPGQPADFLALQLTLIKEHRRGGELVELMDPIAGQLKKQQIEDVAAYYSSLPRF